MLKEERQALILNKLHSSGKVVVSRLAVAVSYTHLDVYKRQLLTKGVLSSTRSASFVRTYSLWPSGSHK